MERAQQLRVTDTLTDDSSSVPSTHMVSHNLSLQVHRSSTLFWPLWAPGVHAVHIQGGKTVTHIKLHFYLSCVHPCVCVCMCTRTCVCVCVYTGVTAYKQRSEDSLYELILSLHHAGLWTDLMSSGKYLYPPSHFSSPASILGQSLNMLFSLASNL